MEEAKEITVAMSPEHLDECFVEMKRRFTRVRDERGYTLGEIGARIAGRTIRLLFDSDEMAFLHQPSMRRSLTNHVPEGADEIYFWRDDISEFTHHASGGAIDPLCAWACRQETARVRVLSGARLLCASRYEPKAVYRCEPAGPELAFGHTTRPLKFPLHEWALLSGMALAHCAAVEVDGCGFLICGDGGGGKSTTAISLMLAGHRLIGDDYVMLDESGFAHMVYSSGFLHQDMLRKMPELNGPVIGLDHWRNDKALMDLTDYGDRLLASSKMRALVFPCLTDSQGASVTKADSAALVMQMVRSTALQNGASGDQRFFRRVLRCVSGLPVYRLNLSTSLGENVRALEQFAKECKKSNVQA